MSRNFSEELDKNDVNYFELVNVSAQAARLINDQVKADQIKLKSKVTTEASMVTVAKPPLEMLVAAEPDSPTMLTSTVTAMLSK